MSVQRLATLLTHSGQGLRFRVSSRAFASSSSSGESQGVIEVSDQPTFDSVLKKLSESGELGIIDWTAKWCGPCRMIAPVYEKLSRKYPDVKFLKVDIDTPALQEVVKEYNITGVPTFMFYKGAKRVENFSGARPDMLEELLKKHTVEKATSK